MNSVTMVARSLERDRTVNEMVKQIERVLPQLQSRCLAEEKAGCLSDETIKILDEIGVFRISIPLEYGGLAFSTEEQRRIFTAIGKISGSTGWVSWVTTTHGRWIAMYSEQAREEIYGLNWIGPRLSGVIAASGPGRARRVEGGYMLSGKWPFCSGCRHTAWSILGALCDGPNGTPEMLLPVVRTAEVEILDDWAVSGMKATGSNTVQIVKEIFVPEHRVLKLLDALQGNWASEPPPGQPLFRNHFIAYTTVLSGSTPLGMAKGALEYYRARLEKRGITATDYTIQADAPITHLQLAEAISRIESAEARLSADSQELDRRADTGEPCDILFLAKIKFDVAASVRGCAEAVELLHRGSGASTIHEANPMQRYARDIRVATVHAQFNYETCAEDYGRALCGKPLFGFGALNRKSNVN